jgi:hypothetical protein
VKIIRAERFTARFECACGERFGLGREHVAHVAKLARAAADDDAGAAISR